VGARPLRCGREGMTVAAHACTRLHRRMWSFRSARSASPRPVRPCESWAAQSTQGNATANRALEPGFTAVMDWLAVKNEVAIDFKEGDKVRRAHSCALMMDG
jgi:hypothetical protein